MLAVTYFEPIFAPWVLFFGAIAFAGATWLHYRARNGALAPRRRWTLLSLRVIGGALLLAVLAGPVSRTEETLKRGRTLTLLVDSSGSMSTTDADGKSRLDAARDAIEKAAGDLARDYDLRVYSFDRRAEFLGQVTGADDARAALDGLKADGVSTALGDAAAQAAPRQRGAALVVLSDGATNTGRATADAAQALSIRGVKVFAAAFGKQGKPNVSVKRVLGPRLLLKHEPSVFFAEVGFSGSVTGPARVMLKQGGNTVATAEAEPGAGPSVVRLNFTPDGEGDITYTVEAAPYPTEEALADNRVDRTVRVAKEKLKVLYVEEDPRWEYRFLKNAILRDDRIAPQLLLRGADKEITAADYNISRFPPTRAELFNFDVVVIGDVNPDFFLPRDVDNLKAFVSEGGGGVLFIAGTRYDPAGYAPRGLGELLPADGSRPAPLAPAGDTLTLTDAGAGNPALTLSTDEQTQFWKTLPSVHWIMNVKPRPAASVLAESIPGKLPVIVEAPFGRGRTMLIATDELWRWRREQGDRYIYRLWAQLVRYLGQRRLVAGASAGELVLSADTLALGQDVSATAYLEDSLGTPLKDPWVQGYVESPDGTRAEVLFGRAGEGAGLYRADFPADGPGKHTLYVKGPAGFVSSSFTVLDEPVESLYREADVTALSGLAAATGGRMLDPGDLASITKLYPPDAATETIRRVKPLWPSWWFLAPIAAAFCLEWYLRKRWNLL